MDPNFRALIIVLVVGTLIMGIGATALFFIFRAYGSGKAGSTKHTALIVALIAFIFLCCLGLFVLSYR
jgi:uncharacterized membrane protein